MPHFDITKIFIVQSLEPGEVQTGRITGAFIAGQPTIQARNFPIELCQVDSAKRFLSLMEYLTSQADHGHIPWLHIECHGDESGGLQFANGSELGWAHLAEALVRLNRATGFNLIAVFAACFGAYFVRMMAHADPVPCHTLFAPTETVDPAELLTGFRALYGSVFAEGGQLDDAVASLSALRLSRGAWMAETAESWFEFITAEFVKEHATHDAVSTKFASHRIKRLQLGMGLSSMTLDEFKVEFAVSFRRLVRRNFSVYFMTDSVVGNAERYRYAWDRIETVFAELRRTGLYAI